MNTFAELASALERRSIHDLIRGADEGWRPFLRRACHRVARPRVDPMGGAIALAQCAVEEGGALGEQARAWLDAREVRCLLPRATGVNEALVMALEVPRGAVFNAGVFPDGRIVLGGGDAALVFDGDDGRLLARVAQVTWATVVGRRLVGCRAGGLVVADAEHLDDVHPFAPDAKAARGAPAKPYPHPDGRRLVIHDARGGLRVVDIEAGTDATLPAHASSVEAVAFDPAGEWVASVASDRVLRVVRLSNRKKLAETAAYGAALAASPDGRTLYASLCEGDPGLYAFDPETLSGRKISGVVASSLCALDASTLAVGTGAGAILLVDVATGSVRRVLYGHGGGVHLLLRLPSGLLLSAAHNDGARIWDPSRPSLADPFVLQGAVTSLAVSAAGDVVLASGQCGEVALVRSTGPRVALELTPQGTVALSPDGLRGAYAPAYEAALFTVDVATGAVEPLPVKEPASAVTFSPDGRHLAAIVGRSMQLFDLSERARVNACDVFWNPDRGSVVVTRDGARVRGASRNKVLAEMRVEATKSGRSGRGLRKGIVARYVPWAGDAPVLRDDGRLLLSRSYAIVEDGSRNAAVVIDDVEAGPVARFPVLDEQERLPQGVEANNDDVEALAFVDDTLGVSGAADGTVRVFSLRDGTQRLRYDAESRVLSLAVARDARQIVVGDGGGRVVWLELPADPASNTPRVDAR